MNAENKNNNICKEHSGCLSDIKHLQQSDEDQWTEINKMKTWLISTLTASLLTLAGVAVNIILFLSKN